MGEQKTKTVHKYGFYGGTEWQHCSDGLVSSYDQSYKVVRDQVRTRVGEFLPNWKNIIRSGGNATTPFSGSESNISWSSCSGEKTYLACHSMLDFKNAATVSAGCTGAVNYYPPPLILDHNGNTSSEWEANNQAVRFLYQAVRRAHAQAEGGVILGEMHKTLTMMARPMMALRQGIMSYVGAVRKIANNKAFSRTGRNKLRVSKLEKVIADTYLEYTYGWSPLINDVKDAAVALARLNHPEYEKTRFRAYGESEKALSNDSITFNTPGQIYFDKVFVRKGKTIVVYYGALQGSSLDSNWVTPVERVIELSGFKLSNFAPTIWELIPYSFLVDYFANVGDLLMAATTDTSRVAWLTKVVIKETTEKVAIQFNSSKSAYVGSANWYKLISLSGSTGGYTTQFRTVTRGSCGMPFLLPTLTVPNAHQFLNIGALLSSSTSGKSWLFPYRSI